MKNYVIIPSGGKGKRAGTDLPKQYLKFNGKEMIAYTLEIFQRSNKADEIIVAAESQYFELLKEIKNQYGITKLSQLVLSGQERQDSVANALFSIHADSGDLITVHDAARPLLPDSVLENAINVASEFGGSVVAIKAKDSLIRGDDFVKNYINREEIYYAQTPQIFKFEVLIKAMQLARQENFTGTDESMLVKRAGYDVKIVLGSAKNFKITSEADIELFNSITSK